jgi:hypothetical protein
VVLLVNMIVGRTRVKFLKRLGIALIFLPELVTTPFGVTLVLVARYLAKKHEASMNKRLHEMVKYYLAHTGHFSDDADGVSSATGPVKRYTQSEEHVILGQITGSRSLEANLAPSVRQSMRDVRDGTVHHAMDVQGLSRRYKAGDSFKVESGWADTSRRAEKTIHHTINREWLSRRYESENSAVAHSNWARTSGGGEGATHHSINMRLLSQRYQTGSVGQTKVKHHTINKALLRQRYGSAVSSTTVLNALRDNNFYYDVVSRGNVIGGYQCSMATNADHSADTLKKRKSTKKGEGENYWLYRYAFMNI